MIRAFKRANAAERGKTFRMGARVVPDALHRYVGPIEQKQEKRNEKKEREKETQRESVDEEVSENNVH